MRTETHRWFSPRLVREMELTVYGHWGKAFIVFPCSRGRHFDYAAMGMVGAIARFIEGGAIKLFAVDSVDAESWYRFDLAPAERNARHEAWDAYLVHEVLPFVRGHNRSPQERPMLTGCSMGAYHAVNTLLKHPELFEGAIALSGLYRLDRPEFAIGPQDIPAVYFNSPLHYLPGLEDPRLLAALRGDRIIVCVGQGAWEAECLEDTRALASCLERKAIPAWVEIWGPEVYHDWPWWFRQMNRFLEALYGPH